MDRKNVKYNISIDGGTSSVGWAVTSMDGKLLKKGNKNLWGVNLFSEAQTAEKRRTYRSTRRRYSRRKQRIKLLQDLLYPMVSKADDNFFKKMQCTYMDDEDRNSIAKSDFNINSSIKDILFDTNRNAEINRFFKGYDNTIYHLRKYCMTHDGPVDPRLIYLAMHHIIKYRGNFLYEGQDFSVSSFSDNGDFSNNLIAQFKELLLQVEDYYGEELWSNFNYEKAIEILVNEEIRNTDKVVEIKKLGLEKKENTIIVEIYKALLGYKFKPKNIFENEFDDMRLSDSDVDEKIDVILSTIPKAEDFFIQLKSIYSNILLKNILLGSDDGLYSTAMINTYNKHHEDLRILKKLIKDNDDKQYYDTLFKNSKGSLGQYELYIHYPKKLKKDFFSEIKKSVEHYKNTDDKKYVLDEIDNYEFLPKQNLSSNYAIPYQLNSIELEKIIDNQGRFYPELSNNKEKIMSIICFRIPYYVGPLVTNKYNKYSWLVRNNEKLYPWNWEEIIDKETTAENFIKRMTNHCTYLLAEDVLPKNSLLYCKYELLNELNKITVNGKLIAKDEKEDIIDNLFMRKTKVSENDLKDFLVNHQYVMQNSDIEIKGFQKDGCFASSLAPYIKFKSIFVDDFDNNYNCIERIIEWVTVYNDKKIIRERIKKEYSFITESQIKKILSINYKGFGRLSRKLLNDIKGTGGKAEGLSIIEVLETTNNNLMQIINNKEYGFAQIINEENEDNVYSSKNDNEIVSELPCSPKIKRCILQTLKIIKELRDYFGHDPEYIFIEMARGEEEKKRTISKAKKYRTIYEDILKQKDYFDYSADTKINDIYKTIEDDNLSDEKMLLYIIQQGKSMYSLKPLDINHLEMCEIDHILPQSYIKDDSIENKALVLRGENQRKGDNLLLDDEIINKCIGFWRYLLDHNLIGEKKYRNLIRKSVTPNEEIGFINRQLVETRQINKYVANILKTKYNTSIVSVKAGLSSEFRKKNDLYKLRILNDTHHAFDAYLAGMIGLFMINKYPELISNIAFDSFNKMSSLKAKGLIHDIDERKTEYKNNPGKSFQSFIVEQLNGKQRINYSTGEIVWNGNEALEYVKKIYRYKDFYITYKEEYGQDKLYKETLISPKELKEKQEWIKAFPTNMNRPTNKYGGYIESQTGYGIAIEYKYKNGVKRVVETIPMYLYNASDNNKIAYLAKVIGVESKDIKIIRDKIYSGQLFVYKDTLMSMASPSEWRCKKQLFVNHNFLETIHNIEKGYINSVDNTLLNELFDELIKVAKIDRQCIASQVQKAENEKNTFLELEKAEKANFLKELIIRLAASGNNNDLRMGSNTLTRFSRTGGVINLDTAVFIYQSTTGIYKKTIKL